MLAFGHVAMLRKAYADFFTVGNYVAPEKGSFFPGRLGTNVDEGEASS